jgi:hypothetical protein
MDSNEETIQKHVVVDSPGQRSEVLTERTQRGPREPRSSTGTIAIVAVLAIAAVAVVLFLVNNRNTNEAANRNANLDALAQAPPTTVVQQPAQQAPVIIQQPAQQAPVIVQQPVQQNERANTSANDDANMQDIATKRLTEEPGMAGVVMTVTDAQAVLTGTVSTAANKAKAEQIVKAVRGMKSVDNKIVVTG